MDYDEYPPDDGSIADHSNIAEIFIIPDDLDDEVLKAKSPFAGKLTQLGNLSERDILDLKDSLDLRRIYTKDRMTEDEYEALFNLAEQTGDKARFIMTSSNSKNGHLTNKLTSTYKNITFDNGGGGMGRRGTLGRIFGRRGGSDE